MTTAADGLMAEATPWIDEALSTLGRSRTGPIVVQRDRPWAVVASLSSDGGTVWFKANHDAFGYEAALLAVLDAAAPQTVLAPLARHHGRGWFLAEDGGPTADQQPHLAPKPTELVDLYVRAQQASAAHADDLRSSGVPDRSLSTLGELFDRACAHPMAGPAAERCAPLRSTVLSFADQLGDADLVITNSDLKPSHVFVGPPARLFDWGDAVLTHPLLGCGTILRGFGVEALTHYVTSWGEASNSPAVQAAFSLSDLISLDVWLRDPAAALDRHPGQIEKLLNQLADKLPGGRP